MKRSLLTLLLLLGISIFAGCKLFDLRHHWKVIKGVSSDFSKLHEEFDRHFLNYDESDPYKN